MTEENLIEIVSETTGISKKSIFGKSRDRKIVVARHMTIFFLRTSLKKKIPAIAKFFDLNHTTVIHAIKKVQDLLFIQDDLYTELFQNIKPKLEIDKEVKIILKFDTDVENFLKKIAIFEPKSVEVMS